MSTSRQELISQARQLQDKARQWHAGLEAREQRALLVLAGALAVFLLYFMVVKPVFDYRSEARQRFDTNAQLLQWIQANHQAFASRRTQAPRAAGGGDWLSRVSAAASGAGITLKGVSPDGDSAVRVQLEEQPFAEVLGWLDTMSRDYGAQIRNINISPGNSSGTVSVRATLQGAL